MKKLIFVILLPSVVYANGPLFQHKDTYEQQEFENVYQDIRGNRVTTNSQGYTCIDYPTLCIDTANHRVSIGTTTVDRKLVILSTAGTGMKMIDTFPGTAFGSGAIGPGFYISYWKKPSPTLGDYGILINNSMNNSAGSETEVGEIGSTWVDPTVGQTSSRMMFSILGYGRTFLDNQVAFSISPTTSTSAVGSLLRFGVGESITSTAPTTGGGYLHSDESAGATFTSGVQPIGGNRYIARAGIPSFGTVLKLGSGNSPGTFEVFVTTTQVLGTQFSVPTSSSQFIVAPAGITQPKQPCFLTQLNSAQNNVTGDGTIAQIPYNNEIYDQSNSLNGSTFTAPIAGKYLLTANFTMEGITTAHTSMDTYIVTTNRSYISTSNLPGLAAVTQYSTSQSVIADMSAGDIAYTQVTINGTGKTADISGAASFRNYFSGSLIN